MAREEQLPSYFDAEGRMPGKPARAGRERLLEVHSKVGEVWGPAAAVARNRRPLAVAAAAERFGSIRAGSETQNSLFELKVYLDVIVQM